VKSISHKQLISAYLQACEFDVQAFKPGNVSVYAAGHDMTVEDFRLSAQVSAEPVCNPEYSLGEKIYYAVEKTSSAVGCNTNLGIILLCAPLICAVQRNPENFSFQQSLAQILKTTTVNDAIWAFRAITLASPGGLGESDDQDVKNKPDINLTQAMTIAAEKDRIALQYATNYADVFNFALLKYNKGFDRFGDRNWAAVAVFAGLLSRYPDSHIERKYGNQHSPIVSKTMAAVEAKLFSVEKPEHLEAMLYRVDQEFKSKGINPGTSADMTVATIFVALLRGLAGENCMDI
jgi:triphosphoribosyl-dephospho-CoA synthase